VAFRFVHSADIHLDSPLRSLALRDPELAALIGTATRAALTAIVDLCLAEQVDALILAGDLYDGEQTSMKTALFLAAEMARLHKAGIRVFIVRGNHDAASGITRELTLPDNVTVFRTKAEVIALERDRTQAPVAIHGLSFEGRHAPDSLLPRYRPPVPGAINIGILHTSLDGSPGHSLYAPCTVADLDATGFRYWALGHIHKRAVHHGAATVVMPGMPQGRDINEAGAKSATLVTIADDGTIHLEERTTALAQFERVSLDATGIADWRALVDAVGAALGAARDKAAAPNLVARLAITGATPLAWRMRQDADLLKGEVDQQAALAGAAFVEKLELAVTPPDLGAGTGADPLVELRRLVEGEILPSDAFALELDETWQDLRKQLPAEVRKALDAEDAAALRARLAGLASEGAEDVLARLQAGGAGEG